MAFGQIDPARLQGEALRRWYLRSPAQIESERHEAARQAYESFFSSSEEGARPGAGREELTAGAAAGFDREGYVWSQTGDHRWSGRRPSAERPAAGAAQVRQLAAAPPTDFWSDWTPCNTLSCHGRPAPSAPPPRGDQLPLPPPYYPRTGGGSGSGRSDGDGREWSDKPECNLQFEKDREICRKAKKAECWENQNKRLKNCSRQDGTIADPPLGFGPPGR